MLFVLQINACFYSLVQCFKATLMDETKCDDFQQNRHFNKTDFMWKISVLGWKFLKINNSVQFIIKNILKNQPTYNRITILCTNFQPPLITMLFPKSCTSCNLFKRLWLVLQAFWRIFNFFYFWTLWYCSGISVLNNKTKNGLKMNKQQSTFIMTILKVWHISLKVKKNYDFCTKHRYLLT